MWCKKNKGISGLVVEYIVAIDVTRVRFPADAPFCYHVQCGMLQTSFLVRRGYATPTANKMETKTTARGFEPLRAEPNGFRVHLLNRSDTVSVTLQMPYTYSVRKKKAGGSGCQGKAPARQHAFARSRRCCSSLAERKHVDTPQAVQRYETIGVPLGIIR